MVKKIAKRSSIDAAIKANDYNAFVTAWNANKPTVPTQAEFAQMVARKDLPRKDKQEQRDQKVEDKQVAKTTLNTNTRVAKRAVKKTNRNFVKKASTQATSARTK
jgi:hypothetical protein